MQLDIFEHSRDVMLRNSVIGTLRVRNAAATARAIDELAAEYAGDSMLPVFKLLCDRLRSRVTGPLNRTSAGELLRAIEGTIAAARFGSMNTGYALRRSSRIPSHCGKAHHAIYRRTGC